MKLIRKLSVYWNLLGAHEALVIAGFCWAIFVIFGVLRHRI
jgi:hypothetical protein